MTEVVHCCGCNHILYNNKKGEKILNKIIESIFEALATPFGYSVLIVIATIILIAFAIIQNQSNKSEESYNKLIPKLSLLCAIIVVLVIILYYPIENFVLTHFTYDNSNINVYAATTTVIITTIGVVVTSIFSYLIYIATKQGIKIANEAKDLSNEMKKIEERRARDERIKKYNDINSVPELRLLMSVDYLLVQINRMEKDILKMFEDNTPDDRNTLAEAINNRKFETILQDMFEKILDKTQSGSDHFIQLLLINNLNNVQFEENFRNQMRLKAVTSTPVEVYREIEKKIGLHHVISTLKKIKTDTLSAVEKDLEEVFKGLLDTKILLNVLYEPENAYEKIWSRFLREDNGS
jgi:hypothetical protein